MTQWWLLWHFSFELQAHPPCTCHLKLIRNIPSLLTDMKLSTVTNWNQDSYYICPIVWDCADLCQFCSWIFITNSCIVWRHNRYSNWVTSWSQCSEANYAVEKYGIKSISNSSSKIYFNSVDSQCVQDKSKNAKVCANWGWNATHWCHWIAHLTIVQPSNTVPCIAL